MRYLGLALYAEGPTDYYFLRPLLQRLCEDLCMRLARMPVEVSEVLALNHPSSVSAAPREVRILAAATAARDAWTLLFVHADGANDPRRAREEQIDPALTAIRSQFPEDVTGIAVIPVRETEAWAIVDGDAVRQAFGTVLDNSRLGLPASTRAAEAVTDPKLALQGVLEAVDPSARRRQQRISAYLNLLGEQVSLSCLRELPAFSRLDSEVTDALRRLQILRG